tara:strand:+ start:3800 stop:4663 length:864 start_codon:yes stop_codon:yes gene_type:complete
MEGGLGKHIMGTAILKVIKKHHPNDNIIVVCVYTDVFKHNPNVNQIVDSNKCGNFYKDVVRGNEKNTKIYFSDPYFNSDYILNKKHLFNIWCEQWGLTYDGEMPEIYLTEPEKEYFEPFYKTDKPIMVIQPNGGPTNQQFNYSWTRDIPPIVVEQVIEEYSKTHTIIHIKTKNQRAYPNTLQALDGFRSIAILLQLADKRLLIDSFSQHLSAALNLPSTVCWVTTKPEVFGYNLHDNIVANEFTGTPDYNNKLFQPFGLTEDITSCPYKDTKDIFNVNEILLSLNKN